MAKKKLSADERRKDALELPVSELGIQLRTVNALEKAGIFTVEMLLEQTADNLFSTFTNFGEKSMEEVYDALAKLGFRRRQKPRKVRHGKKQNQ